MLGFSCMHLPKTCEINWENTNHHEENMKQRKPEEARLARPHLKAR